MSFIPVYLQTSQEITNKIIINKTLKSLLSCNVGDSIKLSFGNKQVETFIDINEQGEECVLSNEIREALGIIGDTKVHMKIGNNVLKIGPVVGILVNRYELNNNCLTGYSAINLTDLLKTLTEEGVFAYVFKAEDINWETNTVNGAVYYVQNQSYFISNKLPLPELVFNRLPSPALAKKNPVKMLFQFIENSSEAMKINPSFFNKFLLHNTLQDDRSLQPFIPETLLSPTVTDIDGFLNRYNEIYLKPRYGSKGRGFIKIKKLENHDILVMYKNKRKLKQRVIQSLEEFLSSFRLRRYLVQQAIDLQQFNGMPFDLRIHMNKGMDLKWHISAIGAKVASQLSITTHKSAGGSIYPGEEVISDIYKERSNEIIKIIEHVSDLYITNLEEKLSVPLCEAGLDVGIDKNDHVWVFEANSRPGRIIFTIPGLIEKERDSFIHLAGYCVSLFYNGF